MIIFKFKKDDIEYADRISELADMSIVIDEPKSFSSDLNEIIQVGVQLAPYVISAVTMILVEMLKKSKKVSIKISENSLEAEGLSEDKALELAKEYIEQQREDKGKEVLNKLLSQDGGK